MTEPKRNAEAVAEAVRRVENIAVCSHINPDGDTIGRELAMRLAVRGMLQKNTIAQWQLKRLRVFAGAEHDHAAQKPEVWDR